MDRNKVTELLKNYPYYKYAVRQYEKHQRTPVAAVASYDDMPRSSSFGSKMPTMSDGISLQDIADYLAYKHTVDEIEGALDVLTEDERAVIELKWIRNVTLRKIEERRFMGRDYAKKIHRRALEKLAICLRFTDVPEIEIIIVA